MPGLLLAVDPAEPGGLGQVAKAAHQGGAQPVRQLTNQQDQPGIIVVELQNLQTVVQAGYLSATHLMEEE